MITLPGTIEGKVALVTGATSGIGFAVASALAKAGADVVINGLGEDDQIAACVAALLAFGGRVHYAAADMTKPDEITAMVDDVDARFGGVDILVNNAGVQHVSPIEAFSPEAWDRIIAVNLSSAFHTVRSVLPGMRSDGWGRIVTMGSAHAHVASPYKAAYVAAKHGALGLTKTIALETAQDGITCNLVSPGYVKTALVERQIADTAKARGLSEDEVVRDVLLSAQWTKQFVTTDQVAGCVLFLCSDAADNITGTSLSVDGGWTAA